MFIVSKGDDRLKKHTHTDIIVLPLHLPLCIESINISRIRIQLLPVSILE